MAIYAIDDLDDALAATREFLTPFDRGVWLRLAVVTLFVGGTGSNVFSWSMGGNGGGGPSGEFGDIVIEPWIWALVAAVVAVAILLGLAVLFVGSVMEFVFVESLRTEKVTVRRDWRRHWKKGLRLFGFRLVLGLFVLGTVLVLAAPFLLPFLGVGSLGIGLLPVALLVLLPIFLLVVLVTGVVHAFTTVFVVPIMLLEADGVLTGWRRLWPSLRSHWRQYLAYALVGFFLSILGGIAVGIATALFVLLMLLPFGLLFAIGFGLFAFVFEPLGILVFALVGLLAVVAVVAFVALAQVPIKTYLRYYALFVLGDVEPAFDVVETQRAAVRDGSTADAE